MVRRGQVRYGKVRFLIKMKEENIFSWFEILEKEIEKKEK